MSSRELSTSPTRNESSFPSQRQQLLAAAAPAAASAAANPAPVNLVRKHEDEVYYYHHRHHHSPPRDRVRGYLRRRNNENSAIDVSPSIIDNVEVWKERRGERSGGGGGGNCDLKSVPCVHRESSSVIDALHNLTSPNSTRDYFRDETADKYPILTSKRRNSRPNAESNASRFSLPVSSIVGVAPENLSFPDTGTPLDEPYVPGADDFPPTEDGISKSGVTSKAKLRRRADFPGVFLKMTSNRYKRTEFEEGDGESVGASSLDSVGASSSDGGGGGGRASSRHDHHGGGFKLFDPAVAFKSPHAWAGRRSLLEKLLLLSLFVCFVVILAISSALHSLRLDSAYSEKGGRGGGTGSDNSSSSYPSRLCLTRDCVSFADSILDSIDFEADPCQDFYQFACGGWIKKHPIPVGHSNWGTFGVLRERNQVRWINKHPIPVGHSNWGTFSVLRERNQVRWIDKHPILIGHSNWETFGVLRERNQLRWIDKHPIPVGHSNWGTFGVLRERNEVKGGIYRMGFMYLGGEVGGRFENRVGSKQGPILGLFIYPMYFILQSA